MVRGITANYLRAEEGLAVRCGCGRQRVLDREALHRLIGGDDLNTIEQRFRCGACGGRPADVWVTWLWVGDFDRTGKPKRD